MSTQQMPPFELWVVPEGERGYRLALWQRSVSPNGSDRTSSPVATLRGAPLQVAMALGEVGSLHEQARNLGVDTYEEAEHRADEAVKAADQDSRKARTLTVEARRKAEALRPKAEAGRELETLRANRGKAEEQLAELQAAGQGYEAAVDRRKQCEAAAEALPHLRVLKEQRPIVASLELKLGGLREDLARLTAEAEALEGTARESREREDELREEIRQLELRQAGLQADLQRARE